MPTPRERTLAVLERRHTDRPPIDLWYTGEVLESLQRHTGLVDEGEIWERLGVDKIVWVNPGYEGAMRGLEGDAVMATPWGCLMRQMRSGPATYLEYMRAPLADVEDAADLDAYAWWPDPEAYDLKPIFEALERHGDRYVTLGPWISLMEIYSGMRGLEESMVDVVANPELVDAALARIETIQERLLERIFTEGHRKPDMVFISDDMGSQASLLISPSAWDTLLRERLGRWCSLIHRHGARVFYHSDGAILPLIPRLIDAGIDVLNPIQHACPGMERMGLREAFGSKIVFHGGVDTQKALPYGTVDDVIAETRGCLDELGPGYLPCSCHNIQAGTPVENILAMIETVRGTTSAHAAPVAMAAQSGVCGMVGPAGSGSRRRDASSSR